MKIGNFILVAALWNWRKTMTRKGKVTIGALTGVLVALLVAIIMSRQFTSLAAEANAIIMEKYSGKSYSIFEVSADLQGLHRRIAQEGGWRGFLAQRILANGGLGFPEVNKPKDRVWFWTCAVGALIAVTGAATQKWWAILATIVAVVWGMPILFTGPVALTIILCGGIVGEMVGGAVAILLPEETQLLEPKYRLTSALALKQVRSVGIEQGLVQFAMLPRYDPFAPKATSNAEAIVVLPLPIEPEKVRADVLNEVTLHYH